MKKNFNNLKIANFNNLKIAKNYTPYNSSWLKLVAFSITSSVLQAMKFDKIAFLPQIVYYAHNLYAGYQYDQAITKTAKAILKGPGGKIDVILKPQDYDAFKIYNVCGLVLSTIVQSFSLMPKLESNAQESNVESNAQECNAQRFTALSLTLGCGLAAIAMIGSKIMHLFSPDKLQYQIINEETGEVIDQKYISKIITQKYISNIITQDDYELEIQPQDIDYNEYVMAAA
jgi:hypothetical protein